VPWLSYDPSVIFDELMAAYVVAKSVKGYLIDVFNQLDVGDLHRDRCKTVQCLHYLGSRYCQFLLHNFNNINIKVNL
jgi:hypothetical protein